MKLAQARVDERNRPSSGRRAETGHEPSLGVANWQPVSCRSALPVDWMNLATDQYPINHNDDDELVKIDSALLAQVLNQLPSGKCWGGNLYLGSMILFDFGERLLLTRPRGSVYVGSTSLSIRNVYWEFRLRNELIETAQTVDSQSFSRSVLPHFLGQSIEGADPNAQPGFIRFLLSNSIHLDLDTTGKWPTEDVLAELTLKDGRYIKCLRDGYLVDGDGDRDLLRLHEYAKPK